MAFRYSPLAAALGLAFSSATWAQPASEVVLGEIQVRGDSQQQEAGYNPPTATSATKI